MKKIFCLILAAVMLLAACTPEPGEVSDITSDTSEDSRQTVSGERINAMYADRLAAAAGEAERTGERVCVSAGKVYTVSSVSENFPDAGGVLADGEFNDSHYKYLKDGWMGISGETVTIEFNLGSVYEGLCDFEASSCKNTVYDVSLCDIMSVSISADGETWHEIGIYVSSGEESDRDRVLLCINPHSTFTAQYVRFTFEGLQANNMLFDEISVYSYTDAESVGTVSLLSDYYGGFTVPAVSEDVYWPETDEDYNTYKNLLSGLPITAIKPLTDCKEDYINANYNTGSDSGRLTDGRTASAAALSDGAYFRFTHGNLRSIVFDLGAVSAVSGVSAGFLSLNSAGVYVPNTLTVSASLDGESWYTVCAVDNITADSATCIQRIEESFGTSYTARYVMITFKCDVHVYCDEIAVFGTKNTAGASDPSETDITAPIFTGSYGTSEDYDGMHDVLLSYIYPSSSGDEVAVTEEQYLAYTAYLKDGEITDTFFDGFMFLPYVKYLYAGGEKKEMPKEDWQRYVDFQFIDGYNMDALDAAVDRTKTSLGLDDDYTVGTYLSIFYPVYGATNFGELNGRKMDFSNIEDRKAVIKWFIDEQIAQFEAKDYDSVRISGFYWFVEEMSGSDPHIVELCNYTCDYVRSLGYQTTWIPYFTASGNTSWRSFGFDTACLQPNYAFNTDINIQRIYDAAEVAKLYGMSIEIEINGTDDEVWMRRYKDYLYVGAETGFMTDTIHMYYLAGMPGALYNAYVAADGSYLHSLYDETYYFTKGLLTTDFAKPDSVSSECESGKSVSGEVTVSETYSLCLGYELAVSPEHGSVSVNNDGSFIYTPYDGYTGEDWFEIRADYGYGKSSGGRVSVNVK